MEEGTRVLAVEGLQLVMCCRHHEVTYLELRWLSPRSEDRWRSPRMEVAVAVGYL